MRKEDAACSFMPWKTDVEESRNNGIVSLLQLFVVAYLALQSGSSAAFIQPVADSILMDSSPS